MIFCVDCKYYKRMPEARWEYEKHICLHELPDKEKYNIVTGELLHPFSRCDDIRSEEKYCGHEGKWFE